MGISLDNTVWKGSGKSNIGNRTEPVRYSFLPGLKVQQTFGNTTFEIGSYIRSSSGAIKFVVSGLNIVVNIGVLSSGTVMNGSDGEGNWQVTKQ